MSWTHTRSKIANRKKKDPSADITDLRVQLRADRAEDYIRRLLDEAPPLTIEQRTRLAGLLKPPRISGAPPGLLPASRMGGSTAPGSAELNPADGAAG